MALGYHLALRSPLVFAARASWVGWALVSLTVCKIASERMWQFESAPAHHPNPFRVF